MFIHQEVITTSIQKLLQCTEQGSSKITRYSPSSNSTCRQDQVHRHDNNRSK